MPPKIPTQDKIKKSNDEAGNCQSPKKGMVSRDAIVPNIVKYKATR